MESQKIYEDSYDELTRINKSIGSSQIIIDFDKLDANTKGVIREALTSAVSKRLSDVYNVIAGVK